MSEVPNVLIIASFHILGSTNKKEESQMSDSFLPSHPPNPFSLLPTFKLILKPECLPFSKCSDAPCGHQGGWAGHPVVVSILWMGGHPVVVSILWMGGHPGGCGHPVTYVLSTPLASENPTLTLNELYFFKLYLSFAC